MSNLVFDIETIGVSFESLDHTAQEYIKKYAENEEELAEAKDRLSFSPLTGEIVAIGVLNPETNKGAVYTRFKDAKEARSVELELGVTLEPGTEKEILEQFWTIAAQYNCFISFNGRSFDVPFLMIRSAILGVKPTKNLMSNRYTSSQKFGALHIDLLDQLTFYGAVRRKFTLHFWTKAFGIKSPKEDGITGDAVQGLYHEGKSLDIARYNLGDLKATKALYEKWNTFINVQ